MQMSSDLSIQERDGFFAPEMDMIWYQMCELNPELKQRTLWKCLMELFRENIFNRKDSVLLWTEKSFIEKEVTTLKATEKGYSLQMYSDSKILDLVDLCFDEN